MSSPISKIQVDNPISKIQEEVISLAEIKQYTLFFSTLHKKPDQEQSGTGDIDYTQTIAQMVNQKFPSIAQYIRNCQTESEVYDFIDKHKGKFPAILHITLNAPDVGFGFTEEGLRQFKSKGGKIVMTALEFNKYTDIYEKCAILKYLQFADSIIFLDDYDKNAAIKAAISNFPHYSLVKKLQNSAIIPVPATIKLTPIPIQNRGMNIGFFGMIRKGKGLKHILRLAQLIKKSSFELLLNAKVMIIGSVLETDQLSFLMKALYPEFEKEIEACGMDTTSLKNLLKSYQKLENEHKLKSFLPIELHVDVLEEEIPFLFNQCLCFFQPHYRGAAYRFSSISTLLSMGVPIISHRTEITPLDLIYGRYSEAMLLKNEAYYQDERNEYADEALRYYLLFLLDRKLGCESSSFLAQTIKKAQKLYQEVLEPQMLVNEFQAIYHNILDYTAAKLTATYSRTNTLITPLEEPSSDRPNSISFNAMFTKLQNFRAWNDVRFILRAYKEVHRNMRLDIVQKSHETIKSIKKRLVEIETQDICPEIRKLILIERTKTGLTPDECSLARITLGFSLEARHITSKYTLNKIKETSGQLISVIHRERNSEIILANHTPKGQGLSDHVFFSIGFKDKVPLSPIFLNYHDIVVAVDVDKLNEENPAAFNGAWFSDHLSAYLVANHCDSFKINDVIFRIEFKTKERVLKFIMPDKKTIYTLSTPLGDEVFSFKNIHQVLALLTIEMVRHLGIQNYTQIMAGVRKIKALPNDCAEELNKIIELCQIRFFPGLCELHQPRQFKICDQPGIKIFRRPTVIMSETEVDEIMREQGFEAEILSLSSLLKAQLWAKKIDSSTAFMKKFIYMTLHGKPLSNESFQKIIKILDKFGLLEYPVSNSHVRLSVLASAMLGMRMDKIQALLSLGPHFPGKEAVLIIEKGDSGTYSLLQLALALFNPERRKEFQRHISLKILIEWDPKELLELLTLIMEGPFRIKEYTIRKILTLDNHLMVYSPPTVSASDIALAFRHYNTQPEIVKKLLQYYDKDPHQLSLCWAIPTLDLEIIQEMVKIGVDVHQYITPEQHEIDKSFPKAILPLQYYLYFISKDRDLTILKFLLRETFDSSFTSGLDDTTIIIKTAILCFISSGFSDVKPLEDMFMLLLIELLENLKQKNLIFKCVDIENANLNIFSALIISGRINALQYLRESRTSCSETADLTVYGPITTKFSYIALAALISSNKWQNFSIFKKLPHNHLAKITHDPKLAKEVLQILLHWDASAPKSFEKPIVVQREDIATSCMLFDVDKEVLRFLVQNYSETAPPLPLHWGLYNGNLEFVKILYDNGSPISQAILSKDCYVNGLSYFPEQITPIQALGLVGCDADIDIVNFLVKEWADVDESYHIPSEEQSNPQSFINFLRQKSDGKSRGDAELEYVNDLLLLPSSDAKSLLELLSSKICTPLTFAINRGTAHIVEKLLIAGATLNEDDIPKLQKMLDNIKDEYGAENIKEVVTLFEEHINKTLDIKMADKSCIQSDVSGDKQSDTVSHKDFKVLTRKFS